ncbi:hypothetical protein AAFH68_05800 [Flavobacterium sp. CGRL1]
MKSQKKTAGNEKTEKEIVKSLQKITAGKKGLFSMQQITINIGRRFFKEVASYNLEQISKACFSVSAEFKFMA